MNELAAKTRPWLSGTSATDVDDAVRNSSVTLPIVRVAFLKDAVAEPTLATLLGALAQPDADRERGWILVAIDASADGS